MDSNIDSDQYVVVPGITAIGFPSPQHIRPDGTFGRGPEGKWCDLSPSKYPILKSEVDLCQQWITQFCKPRKTPSRWDSYALKHLVERCCGNYVSNGAFIAAAIAAGYAPLHTSGTNARFAFWIHEDGFKGSSGYIDLRRATNGYY